MHSILRALLHYVLVTLCLILGFALLVVFRTAYSLMLAPLAASGWTGNAWASTFDKALIVVGGLLFIVLMGVADFYLKNAEGQLALWGRFARLIGIEIFILLGLHLAITIMSGLSAQGLIIVSTELVLGVIAIGFSYKVLSPGNGQFSRKLHQFFAQW